MARQAYIEYAPQRATLAVIDQANTIIDEYLLQGFTLTLRQLFYQFVARAWVNNVFREYKRLGKIVRNARDGGLIDWDAIVDRTREVNTHASWANPANIITSAARAYREDLWSGQKYRPEVWIEKEALLGVIEGICKEYRVPYFAHRGNNSQTLQREAGVRFVEYFDQGLIPIVLHLADHDPKGLDMSRDNEDRLKLYTGRDGRDLVRRVTIRTGQTKSQKTHDVLVFPDGSHHEPVEVRRIALNMEQVEHYNPPANFAKEDDTLFDEYVRQFGTEKCWELDALSPTVIADLIRTELEGLIDQKAKRKILRQEASNKKLLTDVAGNWPKVKKLIDGLSD